MLIGLGYSPIEMIVPEKESMWKDSKYAPRRNPRTGPNAAMLYIHPLNKTITYLALSSNYRVSNSLIEE